MNRLGSQFIPRGKAKVPSQKKIGGRKMTSLERVVLFFIALIVSLVAYLVVMDLVEWPEYRDTNNCAETGIMRSEVVLMPVISGKETIMVPTSIIKNKWKCDNGEIWR